MCGPAGDFWDRRGDLPVIPLNSIQQEMSSWQDTPLLMLPGNHDQVGVKGTRECGMPDVEITSQIKTLLRCENIQLRGK
jgi:hypothetical protein